MFALLDPMLVAAILNQTSHYQDDHADYDAVRSLGASCSYMHALLGG